MAKTNFGLVVTEARGKAGEVVYSRNRGGAYIRKRPHWIPPLTTDVRAVHATMKYVGALWWNTLTDAQRKAWQSLADNILWRDKIGQTNVPIGSALFSQCNFNIVNLGGTAILDPPPALSAIDPGQLDCSATAPATLTVNSAVPLPPNYAPLLRATKCLKPGWSWFNRFLRQLGRGGSPPVPVTLPDAGPAWGVKFGTMTPGWKIGIMLQYVNLLTGAISPPQTQLVTVGGTTDAMLEITATLTDDQIKALPSTPVQLIPAPPLGKTLVIHRVLLAPHFASGPYSNISIAPDTPMLLVCADLGVPLATIIVDDPAATPPQTLLTEFLTASGDIWALIPPQALSQTTFGTTLAGFTSTPPTPNLPLLVMIYNPAGDLTGGDPANTLTVVVFYSIIDAP
jgi:hypothetical protein